MKHLYRDIFFSHIAQPEVTPQTGDTLPWTMLTQTFLAAKALFCQ